jgi:hypothetical protein
MTRLQVPIPYFNLVTALACDITSSFGTSASLEEDLEPGDGVRGPTLIMVGGPVIL